MARKDYFSHDYHARDHLRDVRMDFGLAGYGLYWCVVEILHEQGGSIKESDIKPLAYDLKADVEMLDAILRNYGMFQVKKGRIYSQRVMDNLRKREEISEARRKAAETRWQTDDEITDVVLNEDDDVPENERARAKEFYLNQVENQFNRWLEESTLEEIHGHNVYDYRPLFTAIVEKIRDEDFVIIDKKRIPTFRYLQVMLRHIKVHGSIQNLDTAVRDVETRYAQGKVKNKVNYMIAAIYNAALMDETK